MSCHAGAHAKGEPGSVDSEKVQGGPSCSQPAGVQYLHTTLAHHLTAIRFNEDLPPASRADLRRGGGRSEISRQQFHDLRIRRRFGISQEPL